MKKREERIGFEIRRLDHMLARNVQARVKAAGLDEVTLMHGPEEGVRSHYRWL